MPTLPAKAECGTGVLEDLSSVRLFWSDNREDYVSDLDKKLNC